MLKGFFWTYQVKTCEDIDQAWEILANEFANEQKLMDALLAEINNLKQVKWDSKSVARYSIMTISLIVYDMTDNGCIALESSETLFFMSHLLSELDPRDNTNFESGIQRAGKEENVSNLITWLQQEGTLCSRGKRDTRIAKEKECTHQGPAFSRKSRKTMQVTMIDLQML